MAEGWDGRAWVGSADYPRAAETPEKLGFIVLRHVNSHRTNKYWIECCRRIRKYYPTNRIIIIDDNSNEEYLGEANFDNVRVIKSEYPGRAEILPYYYYLDNREFERAVIVHDSVFLNAPLPIPDVPHCSLWAAPEHCADQAMRLASEALNPEQAAALSAAAGADNWRSCFGCMCIITHDCLRDLNDRYPLESFMRPLWERRCPGRTARIQFEQTMGCMLQSVAHCPRPLVGDIREWCSGQGVPYGGIAFEDLEAHSSALLVKVWTGR